MNSSCRVTAFGLSVTGVSRFTTATSAVRSTSVMGPKTWSHPSLFSERAGSPSGSAGAVRACSFGHLLHLAVGNHIPAEDELHAGRSRWAHSRGASRRTGTNTPSSLIHSPTRPGGWGPGPPGSAPTRVISAHPGAVGARGPLARHLLQVAPELEAGLAGDVPVAEARVIVPPKENGSRGTGTPTLTPTMPARRVVHHVLRHRAVGGEDARPRCRTARRAAAPAPPTAWARARWRAPARTAPAAPPPCPGARRPGWWGPASCRRPTAAPGGLLAAPVQQHLGALGLAPRRWPPPAASSAARSMSAPMPGPISIAEARRTISSITCCTSPTATITLAAMQRWPAQPVNESTTACGVNCGSASGTTMRWFFAPPSASTRLPRAAALRVHALAPRRTEPTKATAWMSGCASSASTASLPPWTMEKTPGGTPASSISSPSMQRGERHLLRGLEDEGVAHRERVGESSTAAPWRGS